MSRSLNVGAHLTPSILGWSILVFACGPGSDSTGHHMQGNPVDTPAIDWGPERYVSYRAAEPIVVDGRMEEEAWRNAVWTSDFVDIEGPARAAPRFWTRAKILWDSTYLYFAAEMEEPHVWATLTDRDAVIYHDNDIEVFIDPDGDTHEYYELEINALGTEWDLFLVKPYRDGGPALNAWDIQGLKTAVFVDGTLNDPSDTDRSWSVEIAIPWKVLAQAAHRETPPAGGDQWRVNFSRVEWRVEIENGRYRKIEEPVERRSRPEDNWVWSPQGLIAMHYPEMWGFVQFSNMTAGSGQEEFFPSVEDEARWFLRQVYYKQHAWFSVYGEFSDDASELGVPDSPFDLEISATQHLFDAQVTVGGRELHIGRDGRIW
ncbi:carbohydrate-binding family 9-like protein [Gemmatimonadota bacterium]